MRLVPARTVTRTTAVLATTSLAIGLLGTLAPAGQASATRSLIRRHPAAVNPVKETITGLADALSGAPLSGLKLPPLTRWRLSHFRAGSWRPAARQSSSSTGSIAGTVTGNGHPLGHICVLAEATHRIDSETTVTAKTGRYQLRGLSAGQYDVAFLTGIGARCPSQNWLEQWYRGVNSSEPTRKTVAVPVRPGKTAKGISARLRRGAEIIGTIRDKSGKPLSGICAATVNLSGPDIDFAAGKSDRSGRYVLSGLSPGKYLTFFMIGCGAKGNYAFQWWRNTPSLAKAVRIKVTSRQVISGIDPGMPPGAAATGTVRAGSSRGKPVSGVCVAVLNDDGLPFEMTTHKTGAFDIRGLDTGRFNLSADPTCESQKSSPYLPSRRTIKVTGGRIRHVGNVPLRVGARLTGVVRDSRGRRLAGVCVQIEGGNFASARTGQSGAYSIIGITPQLRAVRFFGCAATTSVTPQYYNAEPTISLANPIRFRAGKTVSGIDATMQMAGTLTGLVTDRSGHPQAHVCVGIVPAKAAVLVNSGFQSTATTKANGRYLIANITPGPYQVSIGCYGTHFAGRWFNNQQDSARGGLLSIPAGLVTTLNGAVTAPGTVAGNVSSKVGKPLGDICVSLADPKARNFINLGEFPTFSNKGHFRFRGVTPGRYLVQYSSCANGHYATQWYPAAENLSQAQVITVRSGQTTTASDQDFNLGGRISGLVTGPSGEPENNICVQAFNSATQDSKEAITSRSGRYTFLGMDAGHYSLYFAPCSVKGPNLGAASLPQPVKVTNFRTTTGINIALKAGGTISGRVLSGADSKTPQASACVLAVPTDPHGSRQTIMTKNDGSYLLPDLAPGKYQVYFGDPYCVNFNDFSQHEATTAPQWFPGQAAQSAATTITVRAGRITTGIDATMHPYGTITGTVRTQAGKSVSGECVTAVPTEPQFDQLDDEPIPDVTAITTATGGYTLIALPGQYKIKFTTGCGAPVFATQWWPAAPSPNTAQPVTVAYGTSTAVNATLHH